MATVIAWLLANKQVRERVVQKYVLPLLVADIVAYVVLVTYAVSYDAPEVRYIGNHLLSGSTSYLVYEAISIMVKETFVGEDLISTEQHVKKWMTTGALIGGAVSVILSFTTNFTLNTLLILNCVNSVGFAVFDFVIIRSLRRRRIRTPQEQA